MIVHLLSRTIVVYTNKRSQAKVSTVYLLLLVAGHKYLQYIMFKYTAVHGTHNRELMLHCSTLIHLEDRYMSTMSDITVSRWSLSVLSIGPVLVTVYHSAHPTRA